VTGKTVRFPRPDPEERLFSRLLPQAGAPELLFLLIIFFFFLFFFSYSFLLSSSFLLFIIFLLILPCCFSFYYHVLFLIIIIIFVIMFLLTISIFIKVFLIIIYPHISHRHIHSFLFCMSQNIHEWKRDVCNWCKKFSCSSLIDLIP